MLRPLSKDELREILRNSDKTADDATAETVRKLRKFLNTYVRNFKAALADFNVSETEKITLAEMEEFLPTITNLLAESGYGEVVNEFERSMQVVGTESAKYFREFVADQITFGGTTKAILEKMATDFLDDLDFQVNNKLVRPLENSVRNAMMTLDTRADAVREITEVINNEGILRRDGKQFRAADIEVLVQDAPRRFGQQVRNELGSELGLMVYVYAGPNDKITTPQCKYMLEYAPHGAPGFYYKDEISVRLHPNLRENPLVARGHYGCRHEWIPVDEEGAQMLDARFEPRTTDDNS